MATKKLKVEIPSWQMCLKCGGRASPDCHPDEPMCEAHLIRCKKCGATPQPDTDPPMCVECMSQKGGGNDESTELMNPEFKRRTLESELNELKVEADEKIEK